MLIPENLGYAKVNLDTSKVIAKYQNVVNDIKEDQWGGKKKHFRTYLPPVDDKVILELAKNKELVGCITEYIKAKPFIVSVKIWNSVNLNLDNLVSTMQFHRDSDADRMIKMFVNLNDINMENGPLTVIDAEKSHEIAEAVNYSFIATPDSGYFVSDDQAAKFNATVVPLTGKKGDTALVDTCRCFHYGSRIVGDNKRLVLVISYIAQRVTRFGYTNKPVITL